MAAALRTVLKPDSPLLHPVSRPQGPFTLQTTDISFTLQTTDKGPSFETLDLSIHRLVFPHSLRRTLHLFHG